MSAAMHSGLTVGITNQLTAGVFSCNSGDNIVVVDIVVVVVVVIISGLAVLMVLVVVLMVKLVSGW